MNTVIFIAEFLRRRQAECSNSAITYLDKAQRAYDSGNVDMFHHMMNMAHDSSEKANEFRNRARAYTEHIFRATFLGQPFYSFSSIAQ